MGLNKQQATRKGIAPNIANQTRHHDQASRLSLPFLPCALTLALTTTPFSISSAAEESSKPEEIVISTNRIPVPRTQVSTSISTLNTEEIRAFGNISLATILRQTPGISVSNSGGRGQSTSLRIRGEESYRTQVRYDGLLLSDPSAPQVGPILEHLLSQDVTRIEILRGPQGLTYGADAGGIINITSGRPESSLQGALDMQAGRFGTQQLAGNIGAASDKGELFLAITDFSSDGFNARADDIELADNDGYDNTTVHIKAGLKLTEKLRLDLTHHDIDGNSEYDICGFPSRYDCRNTFDQQASRLALAYQGEMLSHSLSYSEIGTERDDFTGDTAAFSSEGKLKRAEYIGSSQHLPGTTLVFGGDYEEALNNGKGRNNRGLFLEYLSDFSEQLFINAGIRHDDNDDFGSNTSYRLSAAYLFTLANNATLKLRSAYGTGFRAPSPYEIDYNRGAFAYPPASTLQLEQESSEGAEVGVEYSSNRMQLEAVYFDQKVEDAIYFDLANFSGYLQDLGTSNSKGLELNGRFIIGEHYSLSANYTFNDSERPDGTQRLRRPRHLLNLGASASLLQNRLVLNAHYRASQDAIDEAGPLDDYGVLDLSAQVKLNDTLTFYSRLENLLDEKYQEVLGYNAAPRAFYLGFRLSFQEY